MRCPFCGAESEGKFCTNCGTKISQEQKPEEQFVPIQPAQSEVETDFEPEIPNQYVPIQPVYATPITQPVQKGPKSNGWCSSGLILSIAGWFCLGLTSPFGFICSLIGLFDSARKHQPGRGKAIAGLILSGIVVLSMGAMIAVSYKDVKRAIDEGSISSPMDILQIMDEATDRQDTSYKKKVAAVTKIDWVEKYGMLLVFEDDSKFTFYQSSENRDAGYDTGRYRLYRGSDAYTQVTKAYKKYGITNSDLNELKDKNRIRNFTSNNMVCLVLEKESRYEDGKTRNIKSTEVYYGYFADDTEDALILVSMLTHTEFNFIPYTK